MEYFNQKMATCNKCAKKCGDCPVKCDICPNVCCIACSELTATEQRVLPLKKRVLFYFCQVCSGRLFGMKGTGGDSVQQDLKDSEGVEIQLLKNSIKDKETIISDRTKIINILEDKISLLNDRIGYLKQKTVKEIPNSEVGSASDTGNSDPGKLVREVCRNNTPDSNRNQYKKISVGEKLDQNSQVDSVTVVENPPQRQEGWTEVVRRNRNKTRKRESTAIIGSLIENGDPKIKVAPRKCFLYVSRLDKDTESKSLVDLLRRDFPEVKCDPLASKYPEHYSSFKVTLDLHNFEKAMNPELWPNGAYVTRFFHPRKKNQVAT